MTVLSPLLVAAACLSLAMAGAWAVQRRTGQSGWIDTIWSLSVGVAAVLALFLQGPLTGRRLAVLGLVALWSLRLGAHIAARTKGAGDDPRYAALMAEWGADAPRRLFGFLQAQAGAGAVLVLALLMAGANPAPFPSAWSLVALMLGVLAVAGETAADAQLARWRKKRHANGICEDGLWARSRHPNYFFEWLFWLAAALLALDGLWPPGLIAALAPVMMYALLRYGSGVPHLEAHMLRTRGAAFAAYQARTPVFFPRLL